MSCIHYTYSGLIFNIHAQKKNGDNWTLINIWVQAQNTSFIPAVLRYGALLKTLQSGLG